MEGPITPADIYVPQAPVKAGLVGGRVFISLDDTLSMLYKARSVDQHPVAKQFAELLCEQLERLRSRSA